MGISVIGGATGAGGGTEEYQLFTSSGNFTVPDGVTKVTVDCIGGSGGGAAAPGGYKRKQITVTPGEVIPVTIGAGATTFNEAGGTSSFGDFQMAGSAGTSGNTTYGNTSGTELDLTEFGFVNVTFDGSGPNTSNTVPATLDTIPETGEVFTTWRHGYADNQVYFWKKRNGALTNRLVTMGQNETIGYYGYDARHAYKNGTYIWNIQDNNIHIFADESPVETQPASSITRTPTSSYIYGRLAADNDYFYLVNENRESFRSADGLAWTQMGTLPSTGSSLTFGGLAINDSGVLMMLDRHAKRVLVSTDQAATWSTHTAANGANMSTTSYQRLYTVGDTFYRFEGDSSGQRTSKIEWTGSGIVQTTGAYITNQIFGYAGQVPSQVVDKNGNKQAQWIQGAYSSGWKTIFMDWTSGVAELSYVIGANTPIPTAPNGPGPGFAVGDLAAIFNSPQSSSGYTFRMRGSKDLGGSISGGTSSYYSPGYGGGGWFDQQGYAGVGGSGVDLGIGILPIGAGSGKTHFVEPRYAGYGSSVNTGYNGGKQGAVLVRWVA